MTFKEWLKKAVNNRSNSFVRLLPELKLVDGTELSVQASAFHMCSPKMYLKNGEYEEVEVYTHGRKIKEFRDVYQTSSFTYGYVTVEFMEMVCAAHGGIKE